MDKSEYKDKNKYYGKQGEHIIMNCMFPVKNYTSLQTSWFYLIRHFNSAVRSPRLRMPVPSICPLGGDLGPRCNFRCSGAGLEIEAVFIKGEVKWHNRSGTPNRKPNLSPRDNRGGLIAFQHLSSFGQILHWGLGILCVSTLELNSSSVFNQHIFLI